MSEENKKRILIVEDDLALAKMYQKKFVLEGFEAIIASTGKEGLELAKKDIDLILLDILLPEIDGLDLLNELKSHGATLKIPVIILTNLGTSDVLVNESMKLGAQDYLVKSQISVQEVIAKVKSALKKDNG